MPSGACRKYLQPVRASGEFGQMPELSYSVSTGIGPMQCIPVARYIDINDSEEILRAIHLTPAETPIDLIVHTPGGWCSPRRRLLTLCPGIRRRFGYSFPTMR
jgi:hypothetical protein